MNKTFCVIRPSNLDYVIRVKVDEHSSFVLTYVFNSISQTYMGTSIECFIGTLRGIIRRIPAFLEEFDESQPVKSLESLGFTQVQPTEMDILLSNH